MPITDVADEVSFEGKHMYLKFAGFLAAFCIISYRGHKYMQNKMEGREAQREGRLLEYQQE